MSEPLVEPIHATPDLPQVLPVLPLKETVVFPESMTPLAIGQDRSIKLIDDVVAGERMLALVAVRESDEEIETPGFDDLYDIGTAAIVHKMIRVPDGTLRILVQGLERIRIDRRLQDEPYLVAEISPPIRANSPLARNSPRPNFPRDARVVKNGSKILGITSGLIP